MNGPHPTPPVDEVDHIICRVEDAKHNQYDRWSVMWECKLKDGSIAYLTTRQLAAACPSRGRIAGFTI